MFYHFLSLEVVAVGGERGKLRVMGGSSQWEEADVGVVVREDDDRRRTQGSLVSVVEEGLSVGPVLAVGEVGEDL